MQLLLQLLPVQRTCHPLQLLRLLMQAATGLIAALAA